MTEEQKAEQNFYLTVAQILGCETEYRPWPYLARTRWNHRNPGNGRYPQHGMVRRYSATMIHVALHTPKLTAVFRTEDQALAAISTCMQTHLLTV